MDPKGQINVELGEKEGEGVYSNVAFITHSPQEIIIDFGRMMPGVPKAKVYSRIIMTPQHAKMLLQALEDNIKKYEGQFGQIKIFGRPDKEIGFQMRKEESK
ncbi:MAG: hypothetical protein A2142_09660 [candidate division Zixibacteria bacterium RBG_16_48_11]|jgi:hypothetical protein|nr:MAG: hypothetical protein A2142_09660 [candidate division Zixibacteria bacterium RBG_16_48_11]